MNVLKNHKKSAVLTLLSRNLSHRKIHEDTGVNRRTIRAIAESISNSPMATGTADGHIQNAPPRPPAIPLPQIPLHARSACEPYREFIEAEILKGRNAMAIYQELVDGHGFTARYNSVKRFCRGLKTKDPEQFDRLDFLPGEEAQVDYGEGAPTFYEKTGKYKKPRLFVMTLRYSRRSFRKVVWKSSKETWALLHEEAFLYFGGVTQYVVLDNLKEGVITPDLYEPKMNSLYVECLAHYGATADPARVRDPDRKGTVENAIQHTQSTALKGKKFESIEKQNEYLMHWEENWAAKRIHGRAKRQVEEMFQEEKKILKPLPLERFQFFTEGVRTVQDDGAIVVDHASYAARPAKIGSEVLVRTFEHEIVLHHAETLAVLRRHPRSYKKGDVLIPEEERIYNPSRQTASILKEANSIGPVTGSLCESLFEKEGRIGHKRMRGIVSLSKHHPNYRIEAQCKRALENGVTSYQSIKKMVEDAAIEERKKTSPGSDRVLTQSHELIRDSQEYFDFWNTHKIGADDTDSTLH